MTISDEKLMAYADGEVDAATAREIEASLARDPALAQRVASYRSQRSAIASAFDAVLEEPVPPRLLAAARGIRSIRPAPRWGVREFSAMAASLLVGAAVAWGLLRGPGDAWITSSADGLVARSELARSLENDLASGSSTGSVRVGVSFRDKSGAYCRTFALAADGHTAGLACRSSRDWQVQMATRDDGGSEAGAFRQAASALPPEVRRAVEERIVGQPLDAAGERAARDRGWRD